MQVPVDMVQNDPLLILLMRYLHLNSVTVTIASIFLLPGVLAAWSWKSGTARINRSMANPAGHGFFSPINLYFLVVAPLNYSIFRYYEVYEKNIRSLCYSHVLQVNPFEIFSWLGGVFARSATGLSFVVSGLLAFLALAGVDRGELRNATDWLRFRGKARSISTTSMCFSSSSN